MKQNIIFFVGADRCGKSNISKELSRQLSIPYFKASNEHRCFLSDEKGFIKDLMYADPRVLDLLQQTGHSIIFDRGYSCEWVYSRDRNRETHDETTWFLDESYAKLGATIVFCYRSSYEGIVDDLDPTIDSKRLKRLDELYREFLGNSRCSVCYLCVDSENLESQVKEIREFLKC